MKIIARSMGIAALILTGFAVVGTGLVAVTYSGTRTSSPQPTERRWKRA